MFGYVKSVIEKFLARKTIAETLAFIEAAKTPKEAQRQFLFDLLKKHANTDFGRDYRFSEIDSIEKFRERLPIAEYDAFAPYIDKVRAGNTNALFANENIVMFALSSGTTKSRKYIPVTSTYLENYRRGWRMWGLGTFMEHPDLFMAGKIGFGSAAEESVTELGVPCGNLSGLTAQMNPRIVQQSYCLPAASANAVDGADRCYLNWRVGLGRDIGMAVAPNPGLLLQFAQYGDTNRDELIRQVREGGYQIEAELPNKLKKLLVRKTKPNPKRADELQAIVSRTGHLYPKDVWPELELICCWLGGPTRSYVGRLEEYFGAVAKRDVGLISSEARMTFPVKDNSPGCVFDVTGAYFEFIPESEIESSSPTILELSDLELDKRYFVVMTTTSGLYRYNIRDVVKVTGMWEQTPLVEFLHKGSRVSNFFGEKVTESQVVAAVNNSAEVLGFTIGDFSVVAPASDEHPSYQVLVESEVLSSESAIRDFAETIDVKLGEENYLYARKRDETLLDPLQVKVLADGMWSQWDREHLVRSGGTLDQYKHPFLISDPNLVSSLLDSSTVTAKLDDVAIR